MRSPLVVLFLLAAAWSGCAAPAPDGPGLPASLLLAEPYPVLVVEVDHAPGLAPDPDALEAFQDALEDLTSKERVVLYLGESSALADGVDGRRDVVSLHRESADVAPTTRGVHGRDDIAFLHVMYVAGGLEGGVVATTMPEHGLIAVFPEAFADITHTVDGLRLPAAPLVERHALLHELGHAFGLVGKGIPMLRDHAAEPGHSANPASVMYRAIRVQDRTLTTVPPLTFDADDIADLEAFRGVVREAPGPSVVQVVHGPGSRSVPAAAS